MIVTFGKVFTRLYMWRAVSFRPQLALDWHLSSTFDLASTEILSNPPRSHTRTDTQVLSVRKTHAVRLRSTLR